MSVAAFEKSGCGGRGNTIYGGLPGDSAALRSGGLPNSSRGPSPLVALLGLVSAVLGAAVLAGVRLSSVRG